MLDGEKQRQEVEESCPPPLAAQLGSHIPRSCSSPRGMQRLRSVHFLSATPCSPFSLAAGWALQAAAPACQESQLQPVFSWSWGCFSPIFPSCHAGFCLGQRCQQPQAGPVCWGWVEAAQDRPSPSLQPPALPAAHTWESLAETALGTVTAGVQ